MEDKRQQLLQFLQRMKLALDQNAISDPSKLQRTLGFEVLEWYETGQLPFRDALRWRFDARALDESPSMRASQVTSYRLYTSPPTGASLFVGGFQDVACIDPKDVTQIFWLSTD